MEDNITADMDNITTPLPNTTLTPESEDSYPTAILVFKFFAVIQFLFSLFSLSMVIFLSIRLKKKAWDSPAKRFGHNLNVIVSLAFLALGVYNINKFHSTFLFLLATVYICFSFLHLFFLYLTAIFVSRLLQIVSPFLNERLKRWAHKPHCATFTEVVCHILLSVLFIGLTPVLFFFIESVFYFKQFRLIVTIEIISIVVFVLFFSSCLIFASVFLMRRFSRNQNIASSIKYMIIKLVFILIMYISFSICTIIAIRLFFNFVIRDILNFTFDETNPLKLAIYVNVVTALYLILSILVVALNHPLDIWCCKCCCRRSPDRAPLLPVNDTEGQQTNPISVWDHRNVPSYTVTNLPYDMSDCRSDYEQLA